MRSIKIIHAADFHLDSPFQALTAAKAAMRREEQQDLLNVLSALAADESADLMLLSGDLLDSENTCTETGEGSFPVRGRTSTAAAWCRS